MPRYYFHIREGAYLTRDPVGRDLPDAEAAREWAITLGNALRKEQRGGPRPAVEIVDQTGRVVDEIDARDIGFQHTYSGASGPTPENAPRW